MTTECFRLVEIRKERPTTGFTCVFARPDAKYSGTEQVYEILQRYTANPLTNAHVLGTKSSETSYRGVVLGSRKSLRVFVTL